MDRENIRFIVGIIGNIIAMCLFLSPTPTFLYIIKKKSVMEYKPDTYLVSVLNCALWIFYGMPFVHPDSLLVITINGAGLILELIYVTIFFIYLPVTRWKKMILMLIIELLLYIGVIVVTLMFFHGTDKRTIFVGSFCVAINIAMYLAPLTVMRNVIQTRSVKYMPLPLSLANFLNGGIWLAYALIKFDPWIAVPNGLGVISGVVQLILYAIYFRTTKLGDDDDDHEVTEAPAEP